MLLVHSHEEDAEGRRVRVNSYFLKGFGHVILIFISLLNALFKYPHEQIRSSFTV